MHPGLHQLLEGLSGLDALMLARVADQQNSVLRADLGEKFAHLVGAGEAGLRRPYKDGGSGIAAALLAAGEKALQGIRRSMPASRSWRAAREVGAKPSTA